MFISQETLMENQQEGNQKPSDEQKPQTVNPSGKKMDPAIQVVRLVIIIIGLPFVLAILGLIILWIMSATR